MLLQLTNQRNTKIKSLLKIVSPILCTPSACNNFSQMFHSISLWFCHSISSLKALAPLCELLYKSSLEQTIEWVANSTASLFSNVLVHQEAEM